MLRAGWTARGEGGRPQALTSLICIPCRHHRRPGILILINSTDWELEGELEYELQDGDEMVFISTLHGG